MLDVGLGWTDGSLAKKYVVSKATIDTVFETARVEEVIGDFVQLKSGKCKTKESVL
jgi:hypothetical protein